MHSLLEVCASRQAKRPAIGTLNEGALHAQLKDWYRRRGDRIEQIVDGFVVDLVRSNLLVEIQTGGFAPLRRKLELILTHQDEVRVYRQGKAFRRHGWVVVGRQLVSVERCVGITCPGDAARLLPPGLPELFDTAELAEAAAIERRLAQQMSYCLRALGVLDTAGKRGNAIVHRRVETERSPDSARDRHETRG